MIGSLEDFEYGLFNNLIGWFVDSFLWLGRVMFFCGLVVMILFLS